MKQMIQVAFFCVVTAFAASHAFAADGAAGMATTGKLLYEDDFSHSEMAPKWKVGKGFFTIKDGVVTAAENPDDKHGAYAYARPVFQFKDFVAEFSVKLDGARVCNLMVNDGTYKESHAGHILKAAILAGKINVADYKYGQMKNDIFEKIKDPKTTPEEKKQLNASIKDKQAVFKVDADFAQWHRIRVEVVGDEMLVSVDGKPGAYLKSEGIAHPTKNAIGFEIGGKSCDLKDVKVWEATAALDWTSRRDAVVGALTKP